MNSKRPLFITALGLAAAVTMAQERPSPPALPRAAPANRHEPPPQAYTDCLGKKAGDAVQHATPEGRVAATCLDSPNGLVARPRQPHDPAAHGTEMHPGGDPMPQAKSKDAGRH